MPISHQDEHRNMIDICNFDWNTISTSRPGEYRSNVNVIFRKELLHIQKNCAITKYYRIHGKDLGEYTDITKKIKNHYLNVLDVLTYDEWPAL